MTGKREPKIELDIWSALFDRRKAELIDAGMAPDDADEQAGKEVRAKIREADR